VTRARRQYDAVDPAHRLVAAELERRWNSADHRGQFEPRLVSLQQVASAHSPTHRNERLFGFFRAGSPPTLGTIRIVRRSTRNVCFGIRSLKEIIATCLRARRSALVLPFDQRGFTAGEVPEGFHTVGIGMSPGRDDSRAEIVRMLARIERDARHRLRSCIGTNAAQPRQSWTSKAYLFAAPATNAIAVYREENGRTAAKYRSVKLAARLGVTPTHVLRMIG